MQTKILSRQNLLIFFLLISASIVALILYFIPKNSIDADSVPLVVNATPIPLPKQPSFGLPVRFKVPKINIDANVEYVGLTSDGAMDVPKDFAKVGWLKLGTKPGEIGSAVIAGHNGISKTGENLIFSDLDKLTKGDTLLVEDDKGNNIQFIVSESRSFDPAADASVVFNSNDGMSHLNLVTCEDWNKNTQSYTKRFVVFADKQ